jgi:serine/threonine protein kinase
MADDYFQLSWDVVQKLLLLKNNQLVQLNKIQCGLLTDKLSETLANVRAEIDSLPPRKQAAFCKQQCREALQELYRVVTEAAIIIRGCCIQDWLTAAVKLINNTEAFVDPFFQLEWCASVIAVVVADQRLATNADNHHHHRNPQRHHSVADQKIEGSSAQECVSKMETIRSMLKPAALEDHGSLAKRLQAERAAQKTSSTHGKKPVLGSDAAEEHHDRQEVKIVANMLKLKPTSFDNNSNASKKVAAAFLPNIEPTDLTFVKRIGGGSFGDVFEVRWLGQKFAKKTFQGFENESFKQEAAILAGLSHPHIVRLFGISIDKRHGCSLVMELMSEDLRACIMNRTSSHDQAPFELAVALDIMLQIAEGMEYLHHRRITHRDLKSSNILVNPVECLEMAKAGYVRAKVADFGLAKTKDTSATFSLQSMVGTTRWRAPELFEIRNSDFVDESADQTSGATGPPHRRYPMKADVYSYAVTCSEILTGDIPFKDEKLADLSERIKYAGVRPHLPASVPPYLASLIERSWDADPSKRPSFSQICAELRHLKASLLIGMLSFSILLHACMFLHEFVATYRRDDVDHVHSQAPGSAPIEH